MQDELIYLFNIINLDMSSFFKNNPHPDERQRKQLGRELGLGPMQIKFWFQNKRTQMKVKENQTLFKHVILRA